MAVGLKLLSEDKGDAFVCAGSTGALVVGSTFIAKKNQRYKKSCACAYSAYGKRSCYAGGRRSEY